MKATLALALVLLGSFAANATAAPTWLAPQDLSVAPSTGTPSGSVVASDAAGETFAVWNRSDGTNVRVQIASHAPGSAWSAATDLSAAGQDAGQPSLSLSGTGFGAIAWTRSDGAHIRVEVSRRAPGGAFGPADLISASGVDAFAGAADLLPGPQVAVDAAGDVVVIWFDQNETTVFGRRFTAATGTWGAIATLATAASGDTVGFPTIAMSAAGVATAAWSFDNDGSNSTTTYQIQTRTQGTDGNWTTVAQLTTTPSGFEAADAQLAVDAAGNFSMTWFQYSTTGCGLLCTSYVTGVVSASTRPAASGVWQPAQTISDPSQLADSPRIAATASGDVTIVWTERGANAIKAVTRTASGAFPSAAAATIIAPQNLAISSGVFLGIPVSSLHLASGSSGTIATFARTDGSNEIAEAVFRPAGGAWPNPSVTQPAALSAPGADVGTADGPNVAFDGAGNAVSTWTRGSVIEAAAFDVSPPSFSAVTVPATGTTGQPVAMSAAASDIWSALGSGQPSWSFGDSTLGAGASLTHTYAAPGTYTVTVGVSDAVGNAATPVARQIVISNPPIPPLPATTVTTPKLKAAWKSNKLVASVTVSGTVGLSTTLKVTVLRIGSTKASVSALFAAKSGSWTHTLKLPSGLAPGTYDVSVTGSGVLSATTTFTLPAPASGIVKRSYATGPPKGPAVTKLGKTSQLWAHFLFGTLPKKGQKITTQWILPSGHKLSPNTRPRTTLVEAQVKDLSGHNLPTGRWRCLIRVGGKVLVTLNVRLT